MSKSSPSGWNPWPWSILAFFCLLVPAVVAYVVFASRQTMDLVRKDYYEEELRFQHQIDAQSRAASAGKPAHVEFDGQQRVLRVSIPSLSGVGRSSSGSLELYRPSDATLDRRVALAPGVDGVQQVDARGLRPGLWRVKLSWTAGQQEFFHADSVVIPPGA
jgi:nitrogen fixation protein FixH